MYLHVRLVCNNHYMCVCNSFVNANNVSKIHHLSVMLVVGTASRIFKKDNFVSNLLLTKVRGIIP